MSKDYKHHKAGDVEVKPLSPGETPVPEGAIPSSGPGMTKCRVHYANTDPDNLDAPISICVNNPQNRKRFYAGTEVFLSQADINALKDATLDEQVVIPAGSGVYDSSSPEAQESVARMMHPHMIPTRNKMTGEIVMINRKPTYIVEQA